MMENVPALAWQAAHPLAFRHHAEADGAIFVKIRGGDEGMFA
jgi:hypothetical protein